MRHRQWDWRPRGWHLMLTIGHGWGLGFIVLGRNGTDIWIGPAVFSIQAPLPASWRFMTEAEIAADKTVIGSDTH